MLHTRHNLLVGLLLLTVAVGTVWLTGCSKDDNGSNPTGPAVANSADCQGCHEDEAMLRATALPDPPPPESSGEG